MEQMKAAHGLKSDRSGVHRYPLYLNETFVLADSQFFPARDGTRLMVDWMSESGNWYVSEGTM